MKIFRTTQKYMKYGGLMKDRGAFNIIQIWTFSKSITFLIMQVIYLVREADTSREYMDSIFMTSAGILIFISYADIAMQNDVLFHVIDELEKVINESEWLHLQSYLNSNTNSIKKNLPTFFQDWNTLHQSQSTKKLSEWSRETVK